MGTSKSPAQFVKKVNDLATVTERKRKAIVTQGALTTKEIILAEAATKGVTPASKIARGKWGVRYDVKGSTNPSALVRIFGPFHLVERDTKPHSIRPRSKGRRRSGKQALAFDGVVRASAEHPGTQGKGIFAAAKTKARVAVPIVMSQRLTGAWKDVLK